MATYNRRGPILPLSYLRPPLPARANRMDFGFSFKLAVEVNKRESFTARMLLSKKKTYLRRLCCRCCLISFPTLLIIFVPCLRQNTYNHRESKHVSENNSSATFPLVREFSNPRARRFSNENARLVGFPVRDSVPAKTDQSTKVIYLATQYFGQWEPKHFYFLHSGKETFARYPCTVGNCYATTDPSDIDRADAVLFHLRDLEVYSFPRYRSPSQTWILYSMEPPWLEVKDMARFNGVFNWTMSYRRDSDVLVKYGFIGKKPLSSGSEQYVNGFTRRKWQSHDIFRRKKNRAIWFVSNCRTDSNREEYVDRLMKIYPVDIVGGCGLEGCRPAETGRCYTAVAEQYKFYLAFENAICRDYVTEKLFNPLEYNVIPVVLGGVNYSRLAPENSVIDVMEFSSPEELGRYLWKVSHNETLYLSYFEWKSIYKSYLQPWMCDLCEKLHSSYLPKTHYDLDRWWHEDESCQRWTTDSFEPVQKHPFPQYHFKLFN